MNQNLKKKCLKGGEHSNRIIQALCLQQTCKSDRLLCFYCIHHKHQNHQIVYLLEGLDSPIEKLNVNSKIQNKQAHQKFIQKKIKKINHEWKNLYRIFQTYINKIQKKLQPQIEAISQSFNQNSAHNFAQIITNANTSPQTIEKYVQKIKLVMQYDLSDINKLKISTGVAHEDLKQAYTTANKQISTIMQKILKQSNLFSVLDCNLSLIGRRRQKILGIDDRNRVNISIEKDKATINSYESRYETHKNYSKRVQNRWIQKKSQFNQNKKHHLQGCINQKNNKICQSNDQNLNSNNQNYQIRKQIQQTKKQNQIIQEQKNIYQALFLQKNSKPIIQDNLQESNNQNQQLSLYDKDLSQQQKSKSPINQELISHQVQFSQKQKLQKIKKFNNFFSDNNYYLPHHQKSYYQRINQINQSKNQYKSFYLQKIHTFDQSSSNLLESQSQNANNSKIQHFNGKIQAQQPIESSQQSSIIRYKNFQYSQSQNSHTPQSINLKQIYLNSNSLQQIQNYLSKISHLSYPYVKSLQIVCDTLPLALNLAILTYILKFTSLKKLVICQANGMKKQHIINIANSLSDLQYLVLEQNYGINDEISEIIFRKLKKLKKFHYTSDPLQHLLFKQQNTEFMSEVDGFTKISTITRLTDLPFLETISFENINKLMDIKNNISKMKKISELSILYHQNQHKINPLVQFVSELDTTKHIIHLQFKQGYFREDSLIQLLNHCKTLKSLGLNKCRDVTNLTIDALKKHKNHLKQLDFMQQDQITGLGFQNFVQLQILSLKACWQINQKVFGSNISKLPKLKCLNLNFNRYWITERIFQHISKIQNLELLEVDNNKINSKALFMIQNLKKLTTLVCGNTELLAEDILNFMSATKSQIEKLSLKRQIFQQKSQKNQISNSPFQGQILMKLSKIMPSLTHLNIKGMKKVKKQYFQQLLNLKCLSCDTGQLDEEAVNFLKGRLVSLYIGYNHFYYDNSQVKNGISNKLEKMQQEPRVKLEQ